MSAFDSAYFEANYRDYAAQNPPRKLRWYWRVIERFAPPPAPRSGEAGGRRELLDIGCGLGRFLAHAAAATGDAGVAGTGGGWRLHGTDVSRDAIEQNRAAWPAIDFRVAAAADRPFPASSFDVITAFDVVEHVPDLGPVAEAVAAMLRPGGLFVFVVPVYDGLSGPLVRALDRDPTHVHKSPRGFWLGWASERFTVAGWWGMLRYLLPGRLYLHLPTHLFRRHTPAILVAAHRSGGGAEEEAG